MNKHYDFIIIGAGAAGLMASSQVAKGGNRVLLLESSNKIGEKIRISGGGRCNFTNLFASPGNYLSANPSFVISALKRYSQHDFIKLIELYNIKYHEKTLGQLFCDGSSKQIIDLLLSECAHLNVEIKTECHISSISKSDHFRVRSNLGEFCSNSLVVASGGLSIPKMGASDFGYNLAKQFGHNIIQTKPGLVPLTVNEQDLNFFSEMSGISLAAKVCFNKIKFLENILFTHRGISGPAILQISSYLADKKENHIHIDLLPEQNLYEMLLKEKSGKSTISSYLKELFPKRFVEKYLSLPLHGLIESKKISECKNIELKSLGDDINNFRINIKSTEGYSKAEITVGGVDTKELSSKNMESKLVPNLYFIGEVVDVTGWLGGYNFQWAWASGHAAGIAI